MRLYLVRHGETSWLREGRLQGHADVPLNEAGHAQSREAALLLKELGVDRVLVSSMRRAQETASWIGQTCALAVEEDTRLNEIFFGHWEGMRADELERKFPECYDQWIRLSDSFCPPEGESIGRVRSRILSFFHDVATTSGRVVAVTHGGPIRLLMLELLKAPLALFHGLRVDPGSITLIDKESGYLDVRQLHTRDGKPEIWATASVCETNRNGA